MENKKFIYCDKNNHYTDNGSFITVLEDGSILTVPYNQIIKISNNTWFDYNDTRYIIINENDDLLLKSGYIVFDNYDTERIDNRSYGVDVRSKLIDLVQEVVENIIIRDEVKYASEFHNSERIFSFITNTGDKFTIVIDTINNIVAKNQTNKINGLSFYPYRKDMDKYGTLYLSVFCKPTVNEITQSNYQFAEKFINRLIQKLNNYDEIERFSYQDNLGPRPKIVNKYNLVI